MKARIPNQPNRGDMMKMVQEMQENMARVTEEVENTEFVTSVGGGAVESQVNGKHDLVSLTIKPEVVDPYDVERGNGKGYGNRKRRSRRSEYPRSFLIWKVLPLLLKSS